MKKLFQTIFMSALSILLFTMPAFAAAPEEIPVVVKSVQETAWAEGLVMEGQASVQLEDGIQVTVSGKTLNGLTLVVYPIPRSDEQAWAWIESCMEKYGTNLYPLDLFFVDSQDNRVEVQSAITVTVTYTGDYQTPAVFYLAENGSVTKMESQAEGTAITFTTDHNSYYVLAETEGINTPVEPDKPDEDGSGQPSDGDTSQPDDTAQPGDTSQSDGSSPQTGDDGQLLVWWALLLVSGGALLILLFRTKKQKEN
jgi:LPXTG-motif cell wall-anchored protein